MKQTEHVYWTIEEFNGAIEEKITSQSATK